MLAYAVLRQSLQGFRTAIEALALTCQRNQIDEAFGCMLAVPPQKVEVALSVKSSLIQSGLIKLVGRTSFSIEDSLEAPDNLCWILMKSHASVDSLLECFFRDATRKTEPSKTLPT